jgi:hypothetical protein
VTVFDKMPRRIDAIFLPPAAACAGRRADALSFKGHFQPALTKIAYLGG